MARNKDDQDRDGLKDGPSQTVRLQPDHEEAAKIGPHFPSGMGADEAALAGATAGMSDRDIEALEARRPSGKKTTTTTTKKDDD